MPDPVPTPTPSTVVGITPISSGVAGSTNEGFNSVIEAATSKINTAATSINAQLAAYDPSDPGSLLQTQQALANYNLAITVTSSIIKSLEDTTKSVAQKLS